MGGYSFSDDIGDGVKVAFPFTFVGPDNGWFDVTDIKVTVDDVETAFTITGPTQVTLAEAPALGAAVRVRRIEDVATPYTDFKRGNNFGKANMNRSFQQQLYVSHQIMDGFKDAGYYEKQALNLGGFSIFNLADGVNAQDAITKSQFDTQSAINEADRVRAEAAADAAEAEAVDASVSADEAEAALATINNVATQIHTETVGVGGKEVFNTGFPVRGDTRNVLFYADGVLQFDALPCDIGGAPVVSGTTSYVNAGSLLPEGVVAKIYSSSVAGLGDSGIIITTGEGTPEGNLVASVGSLYTDKLGGAGSVLYVKESGIGNIGWIAK